MGTLVRSRWEGLLMFIECVKNSGKDYLRLVNSVRVVNKDGYKVSQKKVILNIGPLERFNDGQPNYLERLKNSFKAGNPIIPSLKEYCSPAQAPETYRITFKEGSPDCFGITKLFSHTLLERLMEELGLVTFFHSYKNFGKMEFDLLGFAKLLLFGRILEPCSKRATIKQNDNYFEPMLSNFNPDNVYDTLSFIAANQEKIFRRINTHLVKKANRSPEVVYYDVTNFFFETEVPDDDIFDEDGNVIEKGMRKPGVSKEERKLPIVQMGLFMDNMGIPIAIESFPGNTLDHLTLRPALKKHIDTLDYTRFIMVADRGMCNYMNMFHILDSGNGYVVSKSLLKTTAKERNWAYSEDDYISTSENFRYKSRIIKRTQKDENGTSRELEEQVVVYWSKKFYLRQLAENKTFLEFIDKLKENPANFKITATQAKSVRKFLKKEYINEKTGELINASDIKARIDLEKVEQYKRSLGYYQIITSELNMAPLDVIEKYHGLTHIEDQFRVMKSDLETRPLYVRTKEHINAHLIICVVALIMLRIIQKRLIDTKTVEADSSLNWCNGMSAQRIQEALNKWKVEQLPGDFYRFLDADDPDLRLILTAFDVNLKPKLYRRGELKSLKTNMKVFM